jgi:hypothetical protein
MEAITTEVATLVWGLSQTCWRTIDFPPSSEHNLFLVSTSFWSSCKSQTYFHTSDCVLLVSGASVNSNGHHAFSTGRLNSEFFISERSMAIKFMWLAFHFWVTVMHPTFITCDNAPQKIITLTSAASTWSFTCSSLGLFVRCTVLQHAHSTHFFVTQTCNNLTDTS